MYRGTREVCHEVVFDGPEEAGVGGVRGGRTGSGRGGRGTRGERVVRRQALARRWREEGTLSPRRRCGGWSASERPDATPAGLRDALPARRGAARRGAARGGAGSR